MLRYALTIFVSAFLLFQVQPLIGRFILPWFGGGPSIWTACMLFFQILLLAGSLYAHLVSDRLSPRSQSLIHLCLLAVSVVLLPIAPDEAWKPVGDQSPLLRILLLLLATVGGPYFLLASTGPLMQKWFSQTSGGHSPYRLYALSNIGSLLALLSYPFAFEPWLTLRLQVWSWSALYLVYVCLAGWCAVRFLWFSKSGALAGQPPSIDPPADRLPELQSSLPGSAKASGDVAAVTGDAVIRTDAVVLTNDQHQPLDGHPGRQGWGLRLLWLALSACGSAMLLATTNQLCIDVATVPFLWILPLSLYLLSFIICFDQPEWYDRRVFGLMMIVCLPAAGWAIANGANVGLARQILIFSAALFACCMTCHGELVQLRPDAKHLTLYYLLISAGGVIGGLFVALLAPYAFSDYWEFHFSLMGCMACVVVAWCWQRVWRMTPSVVFGCTLAGALAVAVLVVGWLWLPHEPAMSSMDELVVMGGFVVCLLTTLLVTGYKSRKHAEAWLWNALLILPVLWVIAAGRFRFPAVMTDHLSAQLAAGGLVATALAVAVGRGLLNLTSRQRFVSGRALIFICAGTLSFLAWDQGILLDEQLIALWFVGVGGILMDWAVPRIRRSDGVSSGIGCWAPLLVLGILMSNHLLSIIRTETLGVVLMSRNFYGVLKVEHEETDQDDEFAMPSLHRLMHGQIQHGFQYDDEYWGRQPTTYYGEESGLGLAIQLIRGQQPPGQPIRVGVVGLGTGTIAAYGREGDEFRFYEINPDVRDLSFRYFTYLADSAAVPEVIIGDARIVMERQLAIGDAGQFDLLAVDAFSSDAIPVHLLTAECGHIYRQHLAAGGVLAIHISNRFLDLGPVVRGLADHLSMQAVRIENEDDDTLGDYASTWVLLTANDQVATELEENENCEAWDEDEVPLLWTDDYSGLWPILSI